MTIVDIVGLLPLYTCGIIFFTFLYLIFTYIGPFVSLYKHACVCDIDCSLIVFVKGCDSFFYIDCVIFIYQILVTSIIQPNVESNISKKVNTYHI